MVVTTKPPVTPINAISAPPRAGPIMRLPFIPTESRATALVIPEVPSKSMSKARRDGVASAQEAPATATTK